MGTRDRNEFFDCSCTDHSHLLRIDIYEWNNEKPVEIELSISTQLNHYLPLWKRILMGCKYILGQNTGEWYTTTIVKNSDIERLKNIIKDFENRRLVLEKSNDEKGN